MTDSEQPGKIIPPEMANFLNMDDINVRLQQLITLTEENHNTQLKNNETQLKNQEIQLKNQEILLNTQKIQKQILRELKDGADKGEVLRLNGIVTTTEFTIVNTITDPGHPIKGFEFTNDGVNSIYVGFNVVLSSEGADTIDVTNDITRFELIRNGEDISYSYNRHKIRNIYMLASGGNSDYRLKLIW